MKKEKKCRCKKCVEFRKTHDFEYLDIYGFYYTISAYLYPRLIAFRKKTFSFPYNLTSKKWNEILNKMIFTFKKIAKDERKLEDRNKINEGLKLFAEYFEDLWI